MFVGQGIRWARGHSGSGLLHRHQPQRRLPPPVFIALGSVRQFCVRFPSVQWLGSGARALPRPLFHCPGQPSPVELRGCKQSARRTPMCLADRLTGRTSIGVGACMPVKGQQWDGTRIRWPNLDTGGAAARGHGVGWVAFGGAYWPRTALGQSIRRPPPPTDTPPRKSVYCGVTPAGEGVIRGPGQPRPTPPPTSEKFSSDEKNEIYQRGRKFEAHFRDTTFFRPLNPPPPPVRGGGGSATLGNGLPPVPRSLTAPASQTATAAKTRGVFSHDSPLGRGGGGGGVLRWLSAVLMLVAPAPPRGGLLQRFGRPALPIEIVCVYGWVGGWGANGAL